MSTPVKRPILRLPYRASDYVAEIIALIGLVAQGIIIGMLYPGLPQTIPTHYGFDGRPNAYGDKATIFIVPAITLFLYLLLMLISRFPQAFNYTVPITEVNAERQYRNARALLLWLRAELMLILGYIIWITLQAATNNAPNLGWQFLVVALVAVFGTLAFSIRRMMILR